MKTLTTIIFIFIVNIAIGQDTLQFGVTIPKGANERITNQRTIVYTGKLDFDFYKKHFYVPYYYPNRLVNPSYKNDTITVWNDSKKIGDFKSNWSHTIIYDLHSRVTSFRYSGCMICSQLPYNYHFYYNQLGQVVKMTNNLNDNKTIEFKYDTVGNIVEVKVYRESYLTQEIELINKK